jgi:spore coat polysaccharide biosynthesis protein SpsF (cytidylyltransferase family)
VDPNIVNHLIDIYRRDPTLDFVSNTLHRTFPDGLDVEVLSKKLMESLSLKLDRFYKEWFIMYIHENQKNFRCANYENTTDLSHLRWTVDYPEDYEFVKKIYDELKSKSGVFVMQDVLDVIKRKPRLPKINQKYPADTSSIIYRNEKKE